MGNATRWTLVLVAMAATGCGSGPTATATAADGGGARDAAAEAPATPFTEAAMRAASIAYNTKFCEAAERCDPYFFQVNWGTQETCVAADASVEDLAVWFPYGSTLTPDGLSACASALDLSTCEKYALYSDEFEVPQECRALAYGMLPDGAPCANNGIPTAPLWNQCASGRCFSSGSACGTCAAAQVVGASCNGPIYCDAGEGCAGGTCVAYADAGETCSATVPCHTYLACIGGTCVAPSPQLSCDFAYGCSAFPALQVCAPGTRKCEGNVSGLGEPCGPDPTTGAFHGFCAYPYACVGVPGEAGAGSPGPAYVCAPAPADGQPCLGDGLGQDCSRGGLRFSSCVNNICVKQGAAECSAPPVPP